MSVSRKRTKKFIATVEESKVSQIEKIAKKMEEAGVNVDQVLSFTGIITGSTNNLEAVNRFRGVKTVEESGKKTAL